MSQYERLREEKRDKAKKAFAQTPRTSAADWRSYRTRGQKIGDFYRKKRGERIYKETYLK